MTDTWLADIEGSRNLTHRSAELSLFPLAPRRATAWHAPEHRPGSPSRCPLSISADSISAQGTTVVVALAELFAMFGSLVVADTEAVFVIDPFFDGGLTTIVMVTVVPFAIVPRLQVTIRFVGWVKLHVPWLVVTEPNAVFLGSWSLTDAPAAANGPPLWTLIV
jgi:hypothetical protein